MNIKGRWLDPKRIIRTAVRSTYALAAALLLLISVLMITNIVGRNVGVHIAGVQGLSQILVIWIVFLIIGNLELDDRHLRVNFLVDKLPERAQFWIRVLTLVCSAFVMIIVALASLSAVQTFSGSTMTTFDIPSPVMHSAPLIGGSLLIAAYCINLVAELKS